MLEFCKYFNISKFKVSPYYPQGNGIIERAFRTAKDMIYACCQTNLRDWVEAIPHIEMGLRSAVHKSLALSPYEILFGTKMVLPQFTNHVLFGTCDRSEYMSKMNRNRQLMHEKLMSNRVQENVLPRYKVGDFVMVKDMVQWDKGVLSKRFFGPCKIVEVLGPKTYDVSYQNKRFTRNEYHMKLYASNSESVPTSREC